MKQRKKDMLSKHETEAEWKLDLIRLRSNEFIDKPMDKFHH